MIDLDSFFISNEDFCRMCWKDLEEIEIDRSDEQAKQDLEALLERLEREAKLRE